MKHYIWDRKTDEVRSVDLMTWALWFGTSDRILKQDHPAEDVMVSTVFLGTDHGFPGGPPELWETLVFGGPMSDEMRRYAARAEAAKGHAEMLRDVNDALKAGGNEP